jgi:hypothetical protein
MDDIEQVAHRLGMKPSEVTNVILVDDGVAAQTHDGQWTLITNDGELVFGIDDPTAPRDEAEAAMLRGFRGEPEPEPETKPTPKRRSSR